jgi:hypothetical protein
MANGGDEMAENEAAAANAASRQYDWRPRPDPTLLTTQQLRETETALIRTIFERVSGLRELLETRLDGMDKATSVNSAEVTHIHTEIEHVRDRLREERGIEIQNLRELLESRIDGIDKATKLLAANQDKAPSDTDRSINALRELLGARIDGMDIATKLLASTVDTIPTDVDRAVNSATDLIQQQVRNVQDVANDKFLAIDGTFASNALALTAALAAQKEAAAEQNKSNTLAITKSEQATKETISANAAQTATGLTSLSNTFADIKERVVRLESMGVGATVQRSEQRLDTAQVIQILVLIVIAAGTIFAIIHG